MVPIDQSLWCICDPKTVVDGVEYPPKAGEGKVWAPETAPEIATDIDEVEISP